MKTELLASNKTLLAENDVGRTGIYDQFGNRFNDVNAYVRAVRQHTVNFMLGRTHLPPEPLGIW